VPNPFIVTIRNHFIAAYYGITLTPLLTGATAGAAGDEETEGVRSENATLKMDVAYLRAKLVDAVKAGGGGGPPVNSFHRTTLLKLLLHFKGRIETCCILRAVLKPLLHFKGRIETPFE
jgi:hypothetical protein